MRHSICVLAIFALPCLAALFSFGSNPQKPESLAIDHVTVIDVTGGPALEDRVVVIAGDSIVGMAKSGSIEIPRDARRIDARGKFLIPGLWDMHTHIAGINANPVWAKQTLLPLLVTNGITGIRDMGGDLDALESWRREIENGTLIGPRIVAAGPMLLPARRAGADPAPADPAILRVGTPEESRAAVDDLQKRGADFVKIIEVSRENYFAIADQSKKDSIPFAGHIPSEVTATEASNAGQKSVEHIIYSSLAFDCSAQGDELRQKEQEASAKRDSQAAADITDQANQTFSAEKAVALWRTFRKNGTWVTPTLFSIWVNAHQLEMPPDDPQFVYLPASLRKEWPPAKNPTKDERDTEAWWQRQFENDRKLTGEMHRAGVRLLAGSDSLDRYDFVGTSLHRELQMLVNAGLTPLQALQTATLNPAELLAIAKSGRISAGYLADLVLLDGDPTGDIAYTGKITAVVLHGRFFAREDLDAMLAKARAAAAAIPLGTRDAK
ncbi:MAG TPA: amidohydrolase family protein [Candidatus Acidoferrales bacterium]|nr:amidohydrolase family protein [Candidatus Acidoferrales bacterium]